MGQKKPRQEWGDRKSASHSRSMSISTFREKGKRGRGKEVCAPGDVTGVTTRKRFPVLEGGFLGGSVGRRKTWTEEPGGLLSMGSNRVGHD